MPARSPSTDMSLQATAVNDARPGIIMPAHKEGNRRKHQKTNWTDSRGVSRRRHLYTPSGAGSRWLSASYAEASPTAAMHGLRAQPPSVCQVCHWKRHEEHTGAAPDSIRLYICLLRVTPEDCSASLGLRRGPATGCQGQYCQTAPENLADS